MLEGAQMTLGKVYIQKFLENGLIYSEWGGSKYFLFP